MVAWRILTFAVLLAWRGHAHSRTRRQITGFKTRGTKKAPILSGGGYGQHRLFGVVGFPKGINCHFVSQGVCRGIGSPLIAHQNRFFKIGEHFGD